MIIKVKCPKCMKKAFDYYLGDLERLKGDTVDIKPGKRIFYFQKPEKCKYCGYLITKIEEAL